MAATVSGIAAALVAAVFLLPSRLWPGSQGETIAVETRGGEVRLLEPIGDMRGPFEFRWSSPVAASSYRVSVFDAGHRVMYTESSRIERLPVPPDLRARLVAGGEYTWSVDALDAGGATIVVSARQPFTIASER